MLIPTWPSDEHGTNVVFLASRRSRIVSRGIVVLVIAAWLLTLGLSSSVAWLIAAVVLPILGMWLALAFLRPPRLAIGNEGIDFKGRPLFWVDVRDIVVSDDQTVARVYLYARLSLDEARSPDDPVLPEPCEIKLVGWNRPPAEMCSELERAFTDWIDAHPNGEDIL